MTVRTALVVTAVLTLVGCHPLISDDFEEPDETTAATDTTAGEGSTSAPDPTDGTDSDDGTTAEDGTTTLEGTTTIDGTTTTGVGDEACDAAHYGTSRACEGGGIQYCAVSHYPELKYFWGPCADDFPCVPGDSGVCTVCELGFGGVPEWVDNCDDTTTPLVLQFDRGPVRFASSSAVFDLGPQCGATDWPHPTTPWLALDRDGSGAIESGHELFGSATVLRNGVLADNGFVALAELDHDHDGRISATDPAFRRLLLWADHDGDRRSSAWELTPIADAGVIAIGLSYRNDARCDDRANCEIERATFTFKNAHGHEQVGEVIDVHLACQ